MKVPRSLFPTSHLRYKILRWIMETEVGDKPEGTCSCHAWFIIVPFSTARTYIRTFIATSRKGQEEHAIQNTHSRAPYRN